MTDQEILKALDELRADVAIAAAAMIRRMGMRIEQLELSVDHLAKERDAAYLARDKLIEAHMVAVEERESILDRDARAALALLLAHPQPQGLTRKITMAAWALAEAMADERAKRKASQ